MDVLLAGTLTALWLGILTSVSPCPLATNIAAVSFIARRAGEPRRVLTSGLLYTLGRALAYAALGTLLAWSLVSAPVVSHALQRHMNRILGPVLVLAGMAILELLPTGGVSWSWGEKLRERLGNAGAWGAAPLGFLFALTFCPVSAALFFGSLLPVTVGARSPFLLPFVYGIGTALPVVLVALLLAGGTRSMAGIFRSMTRVDAVARRVSGVAILAVGIYLTLVHVFLVGR